MRPLLAWSRCLASFRASRHLPLNAARSRSSSVAAHESARGSEQEQLLRRWARILSRYQAGAASASEPSPHLSKEHEHLQELVRVFGARLQGGFVPEQLSRRLVHFYRHTLRPGDQGWFFRLVCSELGLDVQQVNRAATNWQLAVSRAESGGLIPAEAVYRAAEVLGSSTRPLYTQLLLPISQLEEGIGFLVQMRADLGKVIQQQPAFSLPLRTLSEHMRQALAGWFTPGLLQLHRVTWAGCSGELLEKVMQYEAVHPLAAWSDLQRRLDPADRRVFAFMHPCLPGEPLVILHTALMATPAHSMTQLLPAANTAHTPQGPGTAPVNPPSTAAPQAALGASMTEAGVAGSGSSAAPKVAVFYSISSTQPGLSGVDLGNFLIKKVARVIMAEFPSIELLVTLSPVPNFRTWLMSRLSYEASQNPDPPVSGTPQDKSGNPTSAQKLLFSGTPHNGSGKPISAQKPGGELPSPVPQPAGSHELLTNEEGWALLRAAQSLPPLMQDRLMAAVQSGGAADSTQQTGGSVQRNQGVRGGQDLHQGVGGEQDPHMPLPQRCKLLSAWLEGDAWQQCPADGEQGQLFERLLLRLAARYLLQERRRNLALDPVANFHLRNGAELWRLNWGADCSERGMQQSFGIMVNYRYELEQVYQRNQDYLVKRTIAVSADVQKLLHSRVSTV